MPKRRAVASESDSEAEQPQAPKRARTNGHADDATAPRASGSRHANGADNDEPLVVDDEEEEVEQEAPDAEQEKEFEEQHENDIRAKIMNTNKVTGSIAEMGIIEKLELHQFMCHKRLEFTFGPQINFIIGHNGSGKSAVLSGLTVALGGKATTTGRGSGLKSFIREGQGAAEVSVTLKNQGEDAYKHDEYGDSIIITRRFTKEGSSSYKMKSKEGKVISTKREELSAICDHMNIQVDNPMNILTQDSARQFLSASQPADKYRFFLRGTQLSQLSEEYSTCLENISQTQKILNNKSQVLPDLEASLEEAKARYREASKARDLAKKVDVLKREMAWAHVAQKEAELAEKIQEVENLKAKVPKIQQQVDAAEAKLREAEESIANYEQQAADLGDIEHLHKRKREIQEGINENRRKLGRIKEDTKGLNESKQSLDRQIKEFERQIEEEQKRMASNPEARREAAQAKLDAANLQLQEAEGRLSHTQQQRTDVEANQKQAKDNHGRLQIEFKRKQEEIEGLQSQLNLIAQRENDKLAPFGQNMNQVVREISKMQWHGRPPVGPLGQYVQVRDAKWANVMRARLGHSMSAFAITDFRDRAPLHQLLRRTQNQHANIIIAEVDLFDYSAGEPGPEYVTVLRALNISDEYVKRILINSHGIERILLAETRANADHQLTRLGYGMAWTADDYTVERYHGGGGRSSLAQGVRGHDRRSMMFTGDDTAGMTRNCQAQLEVAQRQYSELRGQLQTIDAEVRRMQTEIGNFKRQETQIGKEIRDIKNSIHQYVDELNEAMPVGIQSLQDAKETAIEQRKNVMAQFADIARSEAEINEKQHPLLAQMEEVQRNIAEFDAKREGITSKAQDAVEERLKAQHKQGHYRVKLEEALKKVKDAEEVAEVTQEEFTSWTAKAAEFCDKVDNPRTVAEIQRQLESVNRALKEREKRQGASVEEMTIEVNKRQAALDNAKKDLKVMLQLNKSLRKSIRVRLARWHEFRRHIALRCKIYFSYHLSNRGYFGKVLFDHVNGTLTLKVQTDDQAATQGSSREKDPKSLSGGEKSFSTICLLLSLWESIGCPIRCLDEFDVFMDAVNRRISMRMMIDTANASDRKQYILITPQDMTNIHIGNTVRVHRMSDPERGQGILAFS